MNALVLDDELRYREHLKRYLERKGLCIHVAAGAEEAKTLVQEHGVDLMIVDIKLSNSIDGLDFADWVKRRHADTALIVITGYNCPDYEARSRALGAVAYLEKPFSLRELEVHVQRALDQRSLLREIHRLEQELAAARESSDTPRIMQCFPLVCLNADGSIRCAGPEGRAYLDAVVDPACTRPLLRVDDTLLARLAAAAENNAKDGPITLFRRDDILGHYEAVIRRIELDGEDVLIVCIHEPRSLESCEMDELWSRILLSAAYASDARGA